MKKILALVMMAFLAIQFVAAREVVTKDEMQLPLTARNFINQHFTKPQISYIKIDSEFLQGKKYEVVLTNGTELDFNSKGEWTEIDCKRSAIPETIIPGYVKDYMSVHFKDNFVTQIDRDRFGIDVELNNDLSLEFDKNGTFFRLDD